jgi:hypothetical protein
MNKILLELWHDLRAKRLWPVAALLVVALVAVPVVLKKQSSGGSSAGTPPAAAPGAAPDAGKAVVVADAGTSKNSTLGVFNKKDPFRPDKAVMAAAHPKQPSAQTGGRSPAPSGGSTPQSGGGSSGGSSPVTPQPTTPPAPKGPFAYTVDVKFGRFGLERVHHNVQKLDVLPNQNNPLLVFLGVNTAGDTAVFLTDTSLKAAGEGTCKPNGETCSFLYLKLDKDKNHEDLSEQSADGTGTEYSLTLVAIHKVPVSQLAKSAKKAAKAAREAARRARVKHKQAPTPFRVPLKLQLQPDTL